MFAIVLNFGILGFALSQTYFEAVLSRIAMGVGASTIYISILRLAADRFETDDFASINGLTVSVAGIGGVLATMPLARVVALVGWRETLTGIGAIGLALAVLVLLGTRNRSNDTGSHTEEDGRPTGGITTAEVRANVRAVLSDPATWAVNLLLFCSVGVNVTVLGLWGIPYIVQMYEVSVTEAATYTLVGNLGLIVGAPIVGYLSDRFGRRIEFMIVSGIVFTSLYATIAIVGKPPLVTVGLIFFTSSFLSGGFILGYSVIKERNIDSASGVATGTINTAAYTGAAVFPTLLGAALDTFWTGTTVAGVRVYSLVGYRTAFGIAAVGGVVTVVSAVILQKLSGGTIHRRDLPSTRL